MCIKQGMLNLQPNLRAFAVSLCGDMERADDLVQETFVKAWEHRDSFTEGTNLRAWMFTILRNHYFSMLRQRRREQEDPNDELAENLFVSASQNSHMDIQDLSRAWEEVPFDQRQAVYLVCIQGMSYEEAAAIGNTVVGTIKSRVNRGRERLAALLGIEYTAQDDIEPEYSVLARSIIARSEDDEDSDE